MKQYLLSTMIFVMAAMCSCSNSTQFDRLLDEAEASVCRSPDSVLRYLNSSAMPETMSERDEARFHLIGLEAEELSGSGEHGFIAEFPLWYYEGTSDSFRKMKARYYAGCSSLDKGEFNKGMELLHKAHEQAWVLGNEHWIRKSARMIYEANDKAGHPEGALGEMEKLVILVSDDSVSADGLMDRLRLSKALMCAGYYDHADVGLDLVLRSLAICTDSTLIMDAIRLQAKMLMKDGLWKEADALLAEILAYGGSTFIDSVNVAVVRARMACGKVKDDLVNDVRRQLNRVSPLDATPLYLAMADSASAIESMEAAETVRRQALANVSKPYLREYIKAEFGKDESEAYNAAMVKAFAIIIVLIVVFVLFIYRFKTASVKKRLHDVELKNEALRLTVSLRTFENESLDNKLFELLRSTTKEKDRRCVEYFSKEMNGAKKQQSGEMAVAIVKMSTCPKTGSALEDKVNYYQSNLMRDFRMDVLGMKEEDYRLFMFCALGYSAVSISMFLGGVSVESVYNRKARLKGKIRLLDEDKQWRYLKYL